MRAVSGQRSVTEAMVMSGVIASAKRGLLWWGAPDEKYMCASGPDDAVARDDRRIEGMDLSLSLLVIRFAAGMLLMGHGAQKLAGVGGGPGLQGWTPYVGKMGVPTAPPRAAAAGGAAVIRGA